MPLTLGAVLLLAACKGGDGGDSAGGGSTPSAQATQTPAEAGTPEVTQAPPPEQTAEPTEAAGEPSGDVTEACSLLSKAEVEAALGNQVGEGSGTGGVCSWQGESGPISASLTLISAPTLEQCTAEQATGSDVSGLGVEAWWQPAEPAWKGSVIACPEGWTVDILVIHGTSLDSEATLRAAAEELMAKVLQRL